MNRSAIEVGAFSWARIQRLYDADAHMHWLRCESEGLQCPPEALFSVGRAVRTSMCSLDAGELEARLQLASRLPDTTLADRICDDMRSQTATRCIATTNARVPMSRVWRLFFRVAQSI
jgi:hypothetical protein